MAKFSTYMFMISGFLLVFYFLGLNEGGALSGLLNLLLNPSQLKSSELVLLLGSVFTSLTIGVSAIITRAYNPDLVILASLTPLLLEFGYELFLVFNIVKEVSTVFAVLVFSPMLLVYVFTVIEWWRGVTT